MGYTHYYRIPKKLDSEKFKTLSEELKTVSGLLPAVEDGFYKDKTVVLADWDGTGTPQFTDKIISFNGTKNDDMSHETFVISANSSEDEDEDKNGLVFNFCKTAQKPYDIMVCVSLLRLKHHFPECKLSSDGNAQDWKAAKKFYKKVFREPAPKVK